MSNKVIFQIFISVQPRMMKIAPYLILVPVVGMDPTIGSRGRHVTNILTNRRHSKSFERECFLLTC